MNGPTSSGNSVFFTRVLRTLDARTEPEHLFPSRVSFLRWFPSKSFKNLRFLLRFLPFFLGARCHCVTGLEEATRPVRWGCGEGGKLWRWPACRDRIYGG